jgi:hypothetical protein
VIDFACEHIGDRLDAAMGMPRKAGEIVLGAIAAEIIHHQERVEIGCIAEAEGAAQLDARALHGRNGLADALDGTNGHSLALLIELTSIWLPKYCRPSSFVTEEV